MEQSTWIMSNRLPYTSYVDFEIASINAYSQHFVTTKVQGVFFIYVKMSGEKFNN